jgi:hypothetical protein
MVSPSGKQHRTVKGIWRERRVVRRRSGYRVLCIAALAGTLGLNKAMVPRSLSKDKDFAKVGRIVSGAYWDGSSIDPRNKHV